MPKLFMMKPVGAENQQQLPSILPIQTLSFENIHFCSGVSYISNEYILIRYLRVLSLVGIVRLYFVSLKHWVLEPRTNF